MIRVFLVIITLLFCGEVWAADYNEIVFLGDSLTDNGNLYSLLKNIPKSPPYYKGRFSNGPTWAEDLGSYYHDKLNIDYTIYAYGGATARAQLAGNKSLAAFTLESEIYEYYAHSFKNNKSKTLYVIWIGANDYLNDEEADFDSLSSKVVAEIEWGIKFLADKGGKNFMILNLPDLAKTPYSAQNKLNERLELATELHNKKLAAMLKALPSELQVTAIDVYDIFNELLKNTDEFNEKYKVDLKNTTESCWQGGLKLNKSTSKLAYNLGRELQQSSASKAKNLANNLNAHALSDFIVASPALKEAYRVGKTQEEDLTPCDKPDQYFFWDHIHPTRVVHHILAEMVIEAMNS